MMSMTCYAYELRRRLSTVGLIKLWQDFWCRTFDSIVEMCVISGQITRRKTVFVAGLSSGEIRSHVG